MTFTEDEKEKMVKILTEFVAGILHFEDHYKDCAGCQIDLEEGIRGFVLDRILVDHDKRLIERVEIDRYALTGKDGCDEYVRGFNDGHKYCRAEQRAKLSEIRGEKLT